MNPSEQTIPTPITSAPQPAQPVTPGPFATVAWLSPRWIVIGSKCGVLTFDGTTLSFTTDAGVQRFSYMPSEIKQASFRNVGWLFLKSKTKKIHKIAFFPPSSVADAGLAGGVAGSIVGAGVASGADIGVVAVGAAELNTGSKIAKKWQQVLQPFVPEVGNARSLFAVIKPFIIVIALAVAIVAFLDLIS